MCTGGANRKLLGVCRLNLEEIFMELCNDLGRKAET
jgi:hypothetical protein